MQFVSNKKCLVNNPNSFTGLGRGLYQGTFREGVFFSNPLPFLYWAGVLLAVPSDTPV